MFEEIQEQSIDRHQRTTAENFVSLVTKFGWWQVLEIIDSCSYCHQHDILSCQEKKIQKNYEKWPFWKTWRQRTKRTETKKSENKNSCQDQFRILIRSWDYPIRAQFGWLWTWKRSYTINLKSERTKSISVDESDENQLWNNPSSTRAGMSHASMTHKEDSYMGHRKEEISCKRSLVASDRLRSNNLKIQWNNLQ